MNFIENEIYHIFNRGNNQGLIFFEEKNYSFFLSKIEKELIPYCDILAYCLMPNHYHLLVKIKESNEKTYLGNHPFVRKIGTLQSSYTRAIQKQNNITGSLFQQKVKSINVLANNYLLTCFHYIHQNPYNAKLVNKIEDWKFSSFNEYLNRMPFLCNISISNELDLFDEDTFYKESYQIIREDQIRM